MELTEAAPAPQRTERDGIPVWWADLPGTFFASLMFRAGQADEALATRGLTHLVEHLALFGLGRREHPYNGFVDDVRCVFYATGERDEVLEFLRLAAAGLGELPMERLETERRVLRAEGAGAGDIVSRMRGHRFGAAGYGLVNYHELGLRWLGPEEVGHWARERFTRGNAVVWMTGEPPDDLGLELPDGARMPVPEPVQVVMQHPAFLAEGTGGAALSALGERSTALRVALTVAGERLYDRLRRDRGLAYAPYGDYLALGANWAHLALGSDCQDDDAAVVMEEIWRVATDLAEQGVTEEELERYRRGALRALSDPDYTRGELDSRAADELTGAEPYPRDRWMGELEGLTGADVATAARALVDTALIIGPAPSSAPAGGFCPAVPRAPEPVAGRTFLPPPERNSSESLEVGDRGVTYRSSTGDVVTIEWERCAAAERRADGAITLHGHDASWLTLAPSDWAGGDRVLELALERLHPKIVIPVADADAAEAVEEVAQERLEAPGEVGAELAVLAAALKQGERPLDMAAAISDGRRGLLVLTDRRVLWVVHDGGSEYRLDDVSGVTVPRLKLFDGPIGVVTGGGAVHFDVRPMSRARELAAAIEQAAG